MLEYETEFAPFCEYIDEITNYRQYVESVRNNSQHWGGHLEIRALSMALQRPVHIYSSNTLHSNGPLVIDASSTHDNMHPTDDVPIRLSYHLHYYALGEHYNQVVAVDSVPSMASKVNSESQQRKY
jgi:OTU domain-containing protein 6